MANGFAKRSWRALYRAAVSGFLYFALSVGASLFSPAALAQSIAPAPVRTSLDDNGVDLLKGAFYVSTPAISVGPQGGGGLSYQRTWDSSVSAWRDDLAGGIHSNGTSYTVTLFGRSRTFTAASGFFQDEPDGSSLVFNAGNNTYTYTTGDGGVAIYDKALAGTQPLQANEGRITSYTSAAGEALNYWYTTLEPGAQRLQAVRNNFGYMVKFEYQGATVATGGLTLVKATAINAAVDYCDPTANTCAGLTTTCPSLTFAYGSGFETVTDVLGRVTRYGFTASALTGVRRPSSASDNVVIGYDTSNRVSSVSNGVGSWGYAYNDVGSERVVTVTDPLSHQRVTTSIINTQVVKSVVDELSRQTSYTYDSANRVTRVTMPEGNYTQYTYDGRGNVVTTTRTAKAGSGLGVITTSATYQFNCFNIATCNKPDTVTDERGGVTDYTYNNTHGGVLTVTAPAPTAGAIRPQTRYTYSAVQARYFTAPGTTSLGPALTLPSAISTCATTASCANGADETRTTIAFPASGTANNLTPTSVTVRAGNSAVTATTTFGYDSVRNLLTVDGPLSGTTDTTRTRYDAARQVIGVIGPEPDGAGPLKHRARRFSYNLDGQVTSVESGTVNSQSDNDWNAFASLEQVSVTYDGLGRAIQRRLIASGATQAVAQSSYDTDNRLLCEAVRLNPAVFASLPSSACTLGTQGSNGADRITRYTYDAANQVTQITSGFGTAAPINEATSTYTANGLQATMADGAGNLSTFEYDGHDRLLRVRFPSINNGAVSSTTDYEQYSVDGAGNTTQVRLRDGQTITMAFDALNRMTNRDAPGTVDDVTATYDNFSRQLTTVNNGQTLTFGYDQLSRLTSAGSPLGSVTYQYDTAGRRTRMTWPDALYVAYIYNLADDVTAMRENGVTTGAGVLATFAYDNLGRRTSLTRGNGVVTSYGFDPASRLQTLTQNLSGTAQDQTATFGYNAGSQIISRATTNTGYDTPVPTNATLTHVRSSLNQYVGINGVPLTHDARGNLTNDGVNGYGYDALNRLTSRGTSTFAYDAVGRLRESTGAGVTTRFLYDGTDMIGEFNASNTLLRRYVHGPGADEPLVWYEGAGTTDRRWLIADERGSIVAVTNASGAATGTGFGVNSYDEYGIPGPSNVGRFQFTGQSWLPEAQIYHYKARVYLPVLGRFLQTDPIGYSGGFNLYSYVENDPVNMRDPSGNCSEAPFTDAEGNVGSSGTCPRRPRVIRSAGAEFMAYVQYLIDGPLMRINENERPERGTGRKHEYNVSVATVCSADQAFGAIKSPGASAPGAPRAVDGTRNRLLTFNNPITQSVSDRNRSITNTTRNGHVFFPGDVNIKVSESFGGSSVISVRGTGSGQLAFVNDVVGYAFFGGVAAVTATGCSATYSPSPILGGGF